MTIENFESRRVIITPISVDYKLLIKCLKVYMEVHNEINQERLGTLLISVIIRYITSSFDVLSLSVNVTQEYMYHNLD